MRHNHLSKKISAAALVIIFSFTAVGCSSTDGENENESAVSPSCQTAVEENAKAYMTTVANSIESGGVSSGELTAQELLAKIESECGSNESLQSVGAFISAVNAEIDASSEPALTKNSAQLGIVYMCSEYDVASQPAFTKTVKDLCSGAESKADGFLAEANSSANTEAPAEGQEVRIPQTVEEYEVTYIVNGTGTASVNYLENNESRQQEVSLPWEYKTQMTSDYTSIFAKGATPGELSCAILHVGVEKASESDTSDEPFVNCVAIKD